MKTPIKIKSGPDTSDVIERVFRRNYLHEDRRNSFKEPTIDMDHEQFQKMNELNEYFLLLNKCFFCNNPKMIHAEHFRSNDYDEIVISCPRCNSDNTYGDVKSKEYVRWLNNILADYGMSFKDGLPGLFRFAKTGKCKKCNKVHKGEVEYINYKT